MKTSQRLLRVLASLTVAAMMLAACGSDSPQPPEGAEPLEAPDAAYPSDITAAAAVAEIPAGSLEDDAGHSHDESSLEDDAAHDHGAVMHEAPAGARPVLLLQASASPGGGWDLLTQVSNFDFVPSGVAEGSAHVDGEGHMHVYVDEVKVGRMYGHAYHLSPHVLNDGKNEIRVELSAHDHGVITVGGEPVEASLTLTSPGDEVGYLAVSGVDTDLVTISLEVTGDITTGFIASVDLDGFELSIPGYGGDGFIALTGPDGTVYRMYELHHAVAAHRPRRGQPPSDRRTDRA